MDNKKKSLENESSQEAEDSNRSKKVFSFNSNLSDMKKMLVQLKKELEGEDGFNIIFHVSLLWPVSMLNPGVKVLITLKDSHEDEDVASWERVMHSMHTQGWEMALGQILRITQELQLDYLIVENSNSHTKETGWLQ
jgi:hypothetical protein